MLLIKYFRNTKATGFEAQESFSELPPHKDTHCRQWVWNTTTSSRKTQHRGFVLSLSASGDEPAICTSSWLDSGTCTYMHHKEVCEHSLGFSWSPRSAGPRETSSGTRPLPGRASPGECWSHSDHLWEGGRELLEQWHSKHSHFQPCTPKLLYDPLI